MLKRLKAGIYSGIARHYLQKGQFGRAAACLGEVIRLFPNNPVVHANRGVAFQGLNDHRRAIDDLDRAIGLDSRFAVAYFNRGISWKILEDYDRAVADQTQARALAPGNSGPHGELGVLALFRHDFDASIGHLNLAIKLAPRAAEHYKLRGCAHLVRGEVMAAEVDLRYSINLADDPYALLFWYLSCAKIGHNATGELGSRAQRFRSRRWPVAIIDFYLGKIEIDAALATATNSVERAEAEFYVGQWHVLHGNHAHAVTALQAAVKGCPTYFIEHTAAVAELKRLV
jgi:lipoprotein NlpI